MVVVSTRELSFARRGDYDTLKAFFVDDLKLSGTWEQPGHSINSRATQQCNMSPYFYAVIWPE